MSLIINLITCMIGKFIEYDEEKELKFDMYQMKGFETWILIDPAE